MTKNRDKIAWPMSCPECGTGKIRPIARRRRIARHRTLMLEVPANLPIPTCDNCGTEWIDAETAKAVDKALEEAFDREARTQAKELLVAMGEEVTQRRVEIVLGLSQGYLSKVRSGTSTPSAMLLACLRLLSRSPESRLRELEGVTRRPREKARRTGRPQKAAVAGRR
jgi:hypothetical protein